MQSSVDFRVSTALKEEGRREGEAVAAERWSILCQQGGYPDLMRQPSILVGEELIKAQLFRLGVDPGRMGYRYLVAAILLLKEDPQRQLHKVQRQLHKEIYPTIARRAGTDHRAVERAIRTAITDAWSHRCGEIWQCYFPVGPTGEVERPTTKRFISAIAYL